MADNKELAALVAEVREIAETLADPMEGNRITRSAGRRLQQIAAVLTATPSAQAGEVERLATWLEANSSGVYRDCRTAADLLREQERALAESRAEVVALRASMGGDAANHVAIERDHHKARAERLARIGGLLANAAYNLAQGVELTDRQRASLDETRKAWDAALEQEPQE